MLKRIPGTLLELSPETLNNPFSAIEPLLTATGGLTLSQVSELTGIESTTIQNWVKRGWVANPKGKRYCEIQLMRIILINMLRGAMNLDYIAQLMTYINGNVEDSSDDIISDRDLYCHLCRVIVRAFEERTAETDALKRIIDEELTEYKEPTPDATKKLKEALIVMVLTYRSAKMKELAMREYEKIDFFKEA